jgi:ribosomal protein S27E
MPVPSHLVDCVVPKDATIDESPLDAVVRCACGSSRFDLLFPGQTHEYAGEKIPCTAEIDGKFFFLIKARCAGCEREHLLLDGDFHGWNGFVCHDSKQASLSRPLLVPWKCLSCGRAEHEASVQIQTEGKEDFVAETDGEFDDDRWPDGFGWFSMAIKCTGCGKETPEWVSYETM